MRKLTSINSFTFKSLEFNDPSVSLVDYSVIKDFTDNVLYTTNRKYLDDYFRSLGLINSRFINQLNSLNSEYASNLLKDHLDNTTDQRLVLLSDKKYLVCMSSQAEVLESVMKHLSELSDEYTIYANHNNQGYFSSDTYLIRKSDTLLGLIIDLPRNQVRLYSGNIKDQVLYLLEDGSLSLDDASTGDYLWDIFNENHVPEDKSLSFDSFIDSDVLTVDYQGIKIARKSLLSDEEKIEIADLSRAQLMEKTSGKSVKSLLTTLTASLLENDNTTLNDYNRVVAQLMTNYG